MRYKEPSLGASKAIYKGKRYWVIELAESSEIGGFGTDECQYVMYDKLYNGVLATITKNDDGKLSASLVSHVELTYDFDDMRELIRLIPAHADAYYKECGG